MRREARIKAAPDDSEADRDSPDCDDDNSLNDEDFADTSSDESENSAEDLEAASDTNEGAERPHISDDPQLSDKTIQQALLTAIDNIESDSNFACFG